jgi:peptide-methionine (S)-S-oxide reductase
VGYAGGSTKNPTYAETCTGGTGHTEAVLVAYNPERIAYSDLLRQFWECHNPTQLNGQGGDHGTQYRSAAYTYDDEQLALALSSKAAYQDTLKNEIHTEIRPMSDAGPFYYAHEGYQQYLARPGSRQYCSAQPQGVSLPAFESWAPAELLASHAPKLPEAFWQKHGPKPHCAIKGPNEQIVWADGAQ